MMLHEEAQRATHLLHEKVVDVLWRHRKGEVVIQFSDGTRLFIERTPDDLELSITEGIGAFDEAAMRADEDDLSVLVNTPGVEEPFYVKEGQAQDYQLRQTNKEA